MSTEKQLSPSKSPSRARRIAIFLLSVGFAVIFGEVFLRFVELPFVEPRDFVAGDDSNRAFEFDFETMWRYPFDPVEKWGLAAADEFSNRFGCRGYEPAEIKMSSDLRVICVGSSGVAGFGLPLGWAFPSYLERKLQQKYPRARVETVLCGIAGYSSEQQRALLFGRLKDFRPDLVVFLTGTHNDLAPAPERNDQENLDRLRPGFSRTLDLLRFKYSFVNRMVSSTPTVEREGAGDTALLRVPLPRFKDNLDAMFGWVKDQGAQSVVIVPSTKDVKPMRLVYRDVVTDEARARGIPIVDMAQAAPQAGDWLDALHLTRSGHESLANSILGVVSREKLLAPKESKWLGNAPDFQLLSVEPRSVVVGGARQVTLQLDGISESELTRIWCAGQLVTFSWEGSGKVRLLLPRLMPIETAAIEVVTTKGARVFGNALEILPPELAVEFIDAGDDVRIEFKVVMPESTEIAITGTVAPKEQSTSTAAGPVWLALSDTWTPTNANRRTFFEDTVFARGQSFHQGLWLTSWVGKREIPPGTRLVFQGLLGIVAPGNFQPVSVTKPFFYTVPPR
ncbi:MAG: lysophospholipase L1-like esterase [Planctomycetota bacterium]|jgi:lysophospholipase L1-like esterase